MKAQGRKQLNKHFKGIFTYIFIHIQNVMVGINDLANCLYLHLCPMYIIYIYINRNVDDDGHGLK